VPTVLLLRHARTTANVAGTLAGRADGVGLDPGGREQAARLAERLAPLPLAAVVSSPLQRCLETLAPLLAAPTTARIPRPSPVLDERLGECHYGDWTGRALKDLAKEPLWRTVQYHPSAARFPGSDGESLAQMQSRAVAAIREHDAAVARDHGEGALWLAVSHGDVIKAILADALGVHLDAFQRIVVDTASISVVRYTPLRPFVVRSNDTGADLQALVPRGRRGRRRARSAGSASDATVGGETGAIGTA
jgi:probable phosphomutase (TIGR03848 family)